MRPQQEEGIFTQRVVSLVQDSWERVAALGVEKVGIVLFKNIFKIAPGALQLFSFRDEPDLYNSDILKMHGSTVVKTVAAAVQGLNTIEQLVPVLMDLGFKHAQKGVKKEHYPIVG